MNIMTTTYIIVALVVGVTIGYALCEKITEPKEIEIRTHNTLMCFELVDMCDKLETYDNNVSRGEI